MDEWHSLEPQRRIMSLEDAHGGELLKVIQESEAQSRSIISTISSHSPMLAPQLDIFSHHLYQTLLMIEQALRLKKDRPNHELEQLALLDEINQYVGDHGLRSNVAVRLMRHGVEYATYYGGGTGLLPNPTYVTDIGQLKVVGWWAERGPEGTIRVWQQLEAVPGKGDGRMVVTEYLSKTLPEYEISELDFVKMLIDDRNREQGKDPVWVNKRICYTRSQLRGYDGASYFSHRYAFLKDNPERYCVRFDFNYAYPFWVGERKDSQYNIFNDRVNNAAYLDTTDGKYALVFYYAKGSRRVLVYSYASASLVTYKAEWYIAEYLKNNLPLPEFLRNHQPDAYDLSETHPFTTSTVMPANIPETIKDREKALDCMLVSFKHPHLVNNGSLQLCQQVYVYTVATQEGATYPTMAKMHFVYTLVDAADLDDIINSHK
jgi:hypothetical protein